MVGTPAPQPLGRDPVGPVKAPPLPLRPGRGAGVVGPAKREVEVGGRARRAQSVLALLPLVRPPGTGVRGRADRLRVLGGRGAVEEDDLPGLSDSGDEASWEDAEDADLPHDKQQTPCLFCDRFVHLSARRQP